MSQSNSVRRYDLDWLRVLGILTVFVFHSLRFFSLEDWHVKNPITYLPVQNVLEFLGFWMMPLIFFVSGAGIYFALRDARIRSAGKFIKDKVLRLFVPLVVNVFTLIIVQIYLERISHQQFVGSFWQFLPHYFDGIYGFGGNFSIVGNHLWYLAVLFLFSLVLLPILVALKTSLGSRLLGKLTGLLSRFGLFYLLIFAVLLSWNLISPDSILGFDKFNWNLGVYLSMVLMGYIFASDDRLMQSVTRFRWVSLTLAALFTVLAIRGEVHDDMILWSYVLTFVGFARKYLNLNTPLLKYANEAVLPFYILHQTVLLVIGFFVVQWDLPTFVKWAMIAFTSFTAVMGIYEFAIRRVNVLRILFGMKAVKKVHEMAAIPAQAVPEAR
jgi:glucans biosynthesis protein C